MKKAPTINQLTKIKIQNKNLLVSLFASINSTAGENRFIFEVGNFGKGQDVINFMERLNAKNPDKASRIDWDKVKKSIGVKRIKKGDESYREKKIKDTNIFNKREKAAFDDEVKFRRPLRELREKKAELEKLDFDRDPLETDAEIVDLINSRYGLDIKAGFDKDVTLTQVSKVRTESERTVIEFQLDYQDKHKPAEKVTLFLYANGKVEKLIKDVDGVAQKLSKEKGGEWKEMNLTLNELGSALQDLLKTEASLRKVDHNPLEIPRKIFDIINREYDLNIKIDDNIIKIKTEEGKITVDFSVWPENKPVEKVTLFLYPDGKVEKVIATKNYNYNSETGDKFVKEKGKDWKEVKGELGKVNARIKEFLVRKAEFENHPEWDRNPAEVDTEIIALINKEYGLKMHSLGVVKVTPEKGKTIIKFSNVDDPKNKLELYPNGKSKWIA